jgi:hypothetical protein
MLMLVATSLLTIVVSPRAAIDVEARWAFAQPASCRTTKSPTVVPLKANTVTLPDKPDVGLNDGVAEIVSSLPGTDVMEPE